MAILLAIGIEAGKHGEQISKSRNPNENEMCEEKLQPTDENGVPINKSRDKKQEVQIVNIVVNTHKIDINYTARAGLDMKKLYQYYYNLLPM